MPRYIDADRLKRQMEFVCMGIMSGTDPYNAPLNEIADAPTADVRENVHAHWIKHKDRTYLDCWFCSYCNADNYYAYSLNYDTGEYEVQDHFCPNCGAEMDERIEDNA